jgi:hypothetical protein
MTRLSKEKKEVCHTVAFAIYIKKVSVGTSRIIEIQIFHLAKI